MLALSFFRLELVGTDCEATIVAWFVIGNSTVRLSLNQSWLPQRYRITGLPVDWLAWSWSSLESENTVASEGNSSGIDSADILS